MRSKKNKTPCSEGQRCFSNKKDNFYKWQETLFYKHSVNRGKRIFRTERHLKIGGENRRGYYL